MCKKSLSCAFVVAFCLALCTCQEKKSGQGTDTQTEEVKTCTGAFQSKRRADTWYTAHDFPDPKGCTVKNKIVNETISIPIYWVIAGSKWTETDAKEKIDAAKTWFERFCIKLEVIPVTLKTGDTKKLAKDLERANSNGRDAYRTAIDSIYKTLWQSYMWKPPKFLLVMFVDPYSEVKFDNAVVNVSGNFSDIPVILITDNDKSSKHIVTHELVHGLGKEIGSASPPGTRPWVDSADNSWNEAPCADDMGNAGRSNPSAPVTKNDDAPLDWASYYTYSPKQTGNIH